LSRICSRSIGVLLIAALSACGGAVRYDAMVAAASDTRDAFQEVAALVKKNDGVDIGFVFGSSGLLREQVLNGAPYDVYVSANAAYVDEVIVAGLGIESSRQSFAVGRLALITATGVAPPTDLRDLRNQSSYSRIVIANPAHAPYGVAARETLQSLGIYDQVAGRLVLADNVADAVRLVQAGEVDAGLVALPLVVRDRHLVVAADLHQPIRQTLVITSRASDNDAARLFVAALRSPVGRAILVRYGFTVVS
jgi:molybdate transport system substrate-binding protein